MLTMLLNTPGASVLAPVPTFVMYAMSAQFARLRFVGVDLADDFALDLPAMLSAIETYRPALVYLAYPNNPTGNAFDPAAIERILGAAPGLVVLDEAYEPFAGDSWMPRLGEFANLAVMRTVSKIGLAGVRLGYLAADPAWTEELEKVRPPYNVGVLNEAAAEFALEHADVLAGQAGRIVQDREALADALRGLLGRGLVAVYPSRANFILVKVSAEGAAVAQRMRESGVLIKDVGRMHPTLANCLRLTVGTDEENRQMLAALGQALAASPAAG
jgi:histidinol-phosphate aminotransferase